MYSCFYSDLRDKVNALAERKKLSVFTTAELNGGLEDLQDDHKAGPPTSEARGMGVGFGVHQL